MPDLDEMGWPVRKVEGRRVCARPGCSAGPSFIPSDEYRVDGYCSVECRDTHELEERIAELERERDRWKAEAERSRAAIVEIAKGEGEFNRDPLKHAENTIEHAKQTAREALNMEAPDA